MLGPLLRVPARAALAAIFVKSGYDSAVSPGQRVKAAERVGAPAPELAVRANGVAMALGGAAMALGVRPRLAALGLLGSLGVTTYAGHPFWTMPTGVDRNMQLTQFLKNLGLAGGLLLVVAGPGASSQRSRPDDGDDT